MRYTITYSCGHTREMQLYGPRTDRERKVAWMEGQNCPACQLETEGAKAAQANAVAGLPPLTGSPKQIAWAERIRSEAIASAAKVPPVDPALLSAATDPRVTAMGEEYLGVYTSIMARLRGTTSAHWWIDNRGTVEHMLRDACSDVLLRHRMGY